MLVVRGQQLVYTWARVQASERVQGLLVVRGQQLVYTWARVQVSDRVQELEWARVWERAPVSS